MSDLAIVVPVYNEAENVLPMVREVAAAMAHDGRGYELLFVDDGSTDPTWERIAQARRDDPRVRGLRHVRNCGQSAALWTGFQATRTPLIATLDGDLQNDPAELPRMLALLAEADFVCGRRAHRQDNWSRRLSARVARWARGMVLRVGFADVGCGLRVFKRTVLAGVFGFHGLHRFLPILVAGGGFVTLEVPVRHRPRVAGVSKYGVWNRLGRGILDLLAVAWYQQRRLQPVATVELGAACPPTEAASRAPATTGA